MAKLSDTVLALLGKTIQGVAQMTPIGIADSIQRGNQYQKDKMSLMQQEADTQRLTALAHLGSQYDINPAAPSGKPTDLNGLTDTMPQKQPGIPMNIPGVGQSYLTDKPMYDVVPKYDPNGKFTGEYTHIERPKGGKTTPYKPESSTSGNKNFIGNDANGNPLFADKTGSITLGSTPGGGPVLPKNSTMPTSQTRTSGEFADTIIPHIQSLRDLVSQADAKGFIGPAAGRVYGQFLAGTIGSTGNTEADKLLGQLRATDSLLKTGAMKVHFGSRGGSDMYDHFSDMLNSGKQSAATLNGSLDGIQSFMQGYSDAAKPKGRNKGNKPALTPTLGSERQKFIQGAIQKGYSQMEAEGLASQNGLQ